MDLTPNITIVYMFFIFVANFFVLNHFVFKPTLKIIEERHKKSVGLQEQAKNFEDQTAKMVQDYENTMNHARQVARQARENILKTAETESKEMIKKSRSASEELICNAKKEIMTQAEQARVQLKVQSTELAQQMVQKLIQRKVA